MSQDYGLGRGLSSLIPQRNKIKTDSEFLTRTSDLGERDSNRETEEGLMEIEIGKIIANPYQPRTHFDEDKLNELMQSIKNHGILQPLVVTRNGAQFELIAGERRFQAAKRAGIKKVPVIVKKIKEKEKLELAIVENIQRHNLNPIEEAKAYNQLAEDFQMNQEEVAQKMGKSRSMVANKMRLLKLPVEVQKAIIEGRITEGHAKAILAVENKEKQKALFELILKSSLTVRQAEEKTKEISVRSHNRKVTVDPEERELEERITSILGTKVKVKKSGKEGGKIMIDYYSQEELDGILEKIL